MTAKLILSLDGELIQEYPLDKERITIGRKSHNDIVINNLAVSSEHAAIITILHDSFLEDLDSTNGLTVNGIASKKHFMQNNDLIEIGKYRLKYINDQVSKTNAADFEKTVIMRAPKLSVPSPAEKSGDTGYFQSTQGNVAAAESEEAADTHQHDAENAVAEVPVTPHAAPVTPSAAEAPVALAAIQILNGPSAGKELELVKALTTLGKPGVQVAVLTRRPHGFFITHVEGANFPSVNGQVLGGKPHQLNDHDIIELAGIKMEFYFKG